MKKLFSAIAILASFILSMSAMAMQTIGDNELSKVTGQAGVSINLDVTIGMTFELVAWGDSDGIGGTTTAGWVGLSGGIIDDLNIKGRSDAALVTGSLAVLTANEAATFLAVINAQTTQSFASLGAALADPTFGTAAGTILGALCGQFLTIDVYTESAVTKVRIGLPTAVITLATMDATVVLGGTTSTMTQTMGALYVGGMDLKLARNGYVDIYAHAGSGVTMDVYAKIDSLNIAALSWGDTDGLGAGVSNAGYVGLSNMIASSISTNLNVLVDVGTVMSTSSSLARVNGYALKHAAGMCGTTFVELGLAGGLTIGEFSATAVLAADKALANGTAANYNVLGDLYAKTLAVSLASGSWVDILAH